MVKFIAGCLLITGTIQPFKLNLDKLIYIESSHDEMAFNPFSQARGLFQITPILLEEWNNYHPKEVYNSNELHDPKISFKIASWYLGKRIPELLNHYKKPVTLNNILICWNAGIRFVVNPHLKLPLETKNFIRKYESKEETI